MEAIGLPALGQLIMMLLCLCGMPQDGDTLWIDVLGEQGVLNTFELKPTDEGFSLFQGNQDDAEKLMDIRVGESPSSFLVPDDDHEIDLKEVFPENDLSDIATASSMELTAADGFSYTMTRSGDTVYVTAQSGETLSIHR